MIQTLALTILIIGSVFAGLTILIVGNKAIREIREAWARHRRKAIEPAVLAWVHGEKASIQPALSEARGLFDRGVVEAVLLDHVQRVKGIERERLGKALDELGHVDRWIRGLRSPRWWTRANCAERLGLAGVERSAAALSVALEDAEQEVRLRAARALGRLGGAAAVPPLVRTLSEPNRWSTIRIADILAGLGPRVARELPQEFPRLNVHAKLAALDVCGKIRSLESVPWLRERLGDPEPDVRARAAHALGQIGDPDSGAALEIVLEDPEWPVRAMAAKAIGRVRHMAAIPALCRALRDREWWVRANASEALKLMGPVGLEVLEKMLEDQDVFARHQAVFVLQETGHLDRQVDRLDSTDRAERAFAEGYIHRFVQAGQVGRLRELAQTHAREPVRRALASLIPPPQEAAKAAR